MYLGVVLKFENKTRFTVSLQKEQFLEGSTDRFMALCILPDELQGESLLREIIFGATSHEFVTHILNREMTRKISWNCWNTQVNLRTKLS
jgi:hypothetical protein